MTFQRIKSFGLIALITVLIWLLAESESLRAERIQVRLSFHADPESGRMIRVDPGQDFSGTVIARVEGSTAKVEALATALRKELVLEPGSTGIPGEPAQHATIQLQTAIAGLAAVRDSGVVVAEVDPPTVAITVDRLATREFPVRVELPPGQAVDGSPEVSPASVQIRYPASMEPPADLVLIARVDAAALVGLPEGRRTTLTGVGVEMPEALRKPEVAARIAPPQVSVALTLRSRTGAFTLASVPVHIRLAPTELGIWDIQLAAESRLLTEVAVTGPADLIDQVRAERIKPIAYVALSFEDLERAAAAGGTIEKDAAFCDLPTTLRFEPKHKSVRITVKRRETPSGTGKTPG